MPCLHITRQIVTQRSVFDTNRACCLLAIDDLTQKLVSEQNDSFRHRPSITHTFRMTALPKILTWFVPTAPETLHAHFLEAPIMPWDSSTSSEIANTRFMYTKRKLVERFRWSLPVKRSPCFSRKRVSCWSTILHKYWSWRSFSNDWIVKNCDKWATTFSDSIPLYHLERR